MLPLVCKYEPTASENGSMPSVSFEHVLKSSTKLTDHYGNFSKVPQIVCSSNLEVNLIDIIASKTCLLQFRIKLNCLTISRTQIDPKII